MSKKKIRDLSTDERAEYAAGVKSLRQSKGFTQQALADAAGVSRQTINNIERAVKVPQADVLSNVLRVLGVDIEENVFEEQTDLWLSIMGTLIESIDVSRRQQTVDRALKVLAAGIADVPEASEANVGRPQDNVVYPKQWTEESEAAFVEQYDAVAKGEVIEIDADDHTP